MPTQRTCRPAKRPCATSRPPPSMAAGRSATDFVGEPQTFSADAGERLQRTLPLVRRSPRLVAGGPLAADVLKCQLKPPALRDYAVRLTPAEWARLRRVFAAGVCDWRRLASRRLRLSLGLVRPRAANLVFDVTKAR